MPPDMMDADGNATHALCFRAFMSDLLERVRPDAIGVASTKACAARLRFAPAFFPYKANRGSASVDLERIRALREFCRHMGLAEFASGIYEAG